MSGAQPERSVELRATLLKTIARSPTRPFRSRHLDPQHDFCTERRAMAQRFGFDIREIKAAVPRLNAFIETCRKAGVLVVWVREIFSGRQGDRLVRGDDPASTG